MWFAFAKLYMDNTMKSEADRKWAAINAAREEAKTLAKRAIEAFMSLPSSKRPGEAIASDGN